MKYAGMIKNDISAGEGVCVSFFVQGCPHHCQGCHNPETWDFNGGKEFTTDTIKEVFEAITANGIMRNFCVMGGEPLCVENEFLTQLICQEVRKQFPEIKIYVWTGYTYDELQHNSSGRFMTQIKPLINFLIDGPYIQEERDVRLPMRGSRNQHIIEFDTPEK